MLCQEEKKNSLGFSAENLLFAGPIRVQPYANYMHRRLSHGHVCLETRATLEIARFFSLFFLSNGEFLNPQMIRMPFIHSFTFYNTSCLYA